MIALEQTRLIIDGVTIYFSVQLGRCAILSVLLLGLVLLLRKTILKNNIFLKGAVWGLFLIVPFLGKLRFYYENELARKLLLWWQDVCMDYAWVRYGYFLGILASAVWLIRKRWKIGKMLAPLPVESVNGQRVYICNAPMSPFTAGLLNHKIVIPRVVRERMSDRAIATIQLHEKTHIRLGHLWVFFLWDLLCTLLWCNPLLRYSSRYLKDDMEHICDAVTIQLSGEDNISYGKLIIKSMTLLSVESASPATFSGENDYSCAKERINRIRDYTPYKKGLIFALSTACLVIIICLFVAVGTLSYPTYTEDVSVSVVDNEGRMTVLEDCPVLKQAFSYDKNYVYIDKSSFCEILDRHGVEASDLYIVFGCYSKLPGIGGGGNSIYVTLQQFPEDYVKIPYQNVKGGFSDILRWL
ncbi:MAG: M56 family metallopeptidase [Lachnospiraceae bacterium]|nr:M56 family metallopeptidase [Lachnospiraceae bacterium]